MVMEGRAGERVSFSRLRILIASNYLYISHARARKDLGSRHRDVYSYKRMAAGIQQFHLFAYAIQGLVGSERTRQRHCGPLFLGWDFVATTEV